MHTKAIIYDLGNVLIDWNPAYVFDKMIADEERRKYFFANICTADWNEEQDYWSWCKHSGNKTQGQKAYLFSNSHHHFPLGFTL